MDGQALDLDDNGFDMAGSRFGVMLFPDGGGRDSDPRPSGYEPMGASPTDGSVSARSDAITRLSRGRGSFPRHASPGRFA